MDVSDIRSRLPMTEVVSATDAITFCCAVAGSMAFGRSEVKQDAPTKMILISGVGSDSAQASELTLSAQALPTD